METERMFFENHGFFSRVPDTWLVTYHPIDPGGANFHIYTQYMTAFMGPPGRYPKFPKFFEKKRPMTDFAGFQNFPSRYMALFGYI